MSTDRPPTPDPPPRPDRPSHEEFLAELAALDEVLRRPVESKRPPLRPPDLKLEERDLVLPPPDSIALRESVGSAAAPRRARFSGALIAALCGGLLGGGCLGLWLATSSFGRITPTETVARASSTKAPRAPRVASRPVRPATLPSAASTAAASAAAASTAAAAAANAEGALSDAARLDVARAPDAIVPAERGATSPSSLVLPPASSDWIAKAAPVVMTGPIAPPPAIASRAGIPSASIAPVPLKDAPSRVSAATAVVAADEAGIEATLRRYEQAYERLDAKAAVAIWPTVDRRALSRAFAGLASQALDMRGCEVMVRAGASTATASCRGSAEYVRKVGDGRVRVEPRQWTFTLNKTEGEWIIDTVDGQR